MPPIIADMVRVQQFAGMRPQDVRNLRQSVVRKGSESHGGDRVNPPVVYAPCNFANDKDTNKWDNMRSVPFVNKKIFEEKK